MPPFCYGAPSQNNFERGPNSKRLIHLFLIFANIDLDFAIPELFDRRIIGIHCLILYRKLIIKVNHRASVENVCKILLTRLQNSKR